LFLQEFIKGRTVTDRDARNFVFGEALDKTVESSGLIGVTDIHTTILYKLPEK
jgi:hypothetical protein